MKLILTNLRIIAAFFLLSLLPCPGQQESKAMVRSAMFPGSGIQKPLGLYVGDGKETFPVPVWGGKFSPEFELPRLEIWRFGHWAEEKNSEGRAVKVFKEQARVKPPGSSRVWLIFFQRQQGEVQTLQVQAFGVDENSLKEGGVVIMNLTKGPVGFEIPNKQIKIKPTEMAVVSPESTRGQTYPVKFYYAHNGEARPFVTTTWFHGERRKRLAIVVQENETSPPKLLTIDDIAAEKAVREPEAGNPNNQNP